MLCVLSIDVVTLIKFICALFEAEREKENEREQYKDGQIELMSVVCHCKLSSFKTFFTSSLCESSDSHDSG